MTRSKLAPLAAASILTLLGAGCAAAQPATPPVATGGATPASQSSSPQAGSPTAAENGAAKQPVFTADPCALVTADDAKTILGGPVNPAYAEQSEIPAGKFCRYTTTRESDLSRMIEITVYESDNILASVYELPADAYFQNLKKAHIASRPDDIETLGGLGDDAYWDGSGIRVLKDTYVFVVSARGFGSGGADTDKKNKEATLKVAEQIVAGLK